MAFTAAILSLGLISGLTAFPALSAPAASSTGVSSSQNPSGFGETVTFSASVGGSGGGAAIGTVTFKDGAKTLGSTALKTIGAGRSPAAGAFHSCALTATGGVQCWGRNNKGQLGDNSIAEKTTPVDVVGLASGVAAIVAGGEHTCALTKTGGVKCWGGNGDGQLGDNSKIERHTPVDVAGLTNGVAAIAANGFYTCALTWAGGAKCWGRNVNGQLGDGTTTERPAPVDVVGLSSGITAIATGTAHTCAVTDAGGAKCWGYNANGRLGNGSTSESHVPVNVIGLASGVAAIAAGTGHTCALTNAGGIKCWGNNTSGQLGDNSIADSHVPVGVDGLGSGVAAIANGFDHVCALTKTGSLKCWGSNGFGQLGDTTTDNSDTPVDVNGLGAGTALVFSEAAVSTATLSTGNHVVTASYGGNGDHTGSNATLTQVIAKGATEAKIKLKPKKPKAGKTVRIVVKLAAVAPASGNPNGKVTVKDGRKTLGKFKVKNGKAKIKLRDLKAGKHKIKAKYPGGKNWEKSAAKAKFTAK